MPSTSQDSSASNVDLSALPHEVRYKSLITGGDALYDRYPNQHAALHAAVEFRRKCVVFDNRQMAASIKINPL